MPIEPATPAAIVARWRKAQQQLVESAPGSPDHDRLTELVRDLAEQYRRAIEAHAHESRSLQGRKPAART